MMDKVLKQRLVGATILIALAVIFVPMLFQSPDREQERRAEIDVPDRRDNGVDTRRLPLEPRRDRDRVEEEPDPPTPEPVVPEAPEASPEFDPVTPGAHEDEPAIPDDESDPAMEPVDEFDPEPVPDEAPADTPEPETRTLPAEQEAMTGWLVQVASFGSAESAEGVAERLDALGYSTLTDTVTRQGSSLHRVRVGPFDSESGAEQARGQIQQTIDGVQPAVIRAPGASPGGSSGQVMEGRFAVQVGVFGSRENAESLRDDLVGRDFSAFVGEQRSGDRQVWRVRVGPVMDRDQARALLQRLEDEADLEGMVVSHP